MNRFWRIILGKVCLSNTHTHRYYSFCWPAVGAIWAQGCPTFIRSVYSSPFFDNYGMGRFPGEGDQLPWRSNQLQYSCLGNPMDRGAWWATVHGVTRSTSAFSSFSSTVFWPTAILKSTEQQVDLSNRLFSNMEGQWWPRAAGVGGVSEKIRG